MKIINAIRVTKNIRKAVFRIIILYIIVHSNVYSQVTEDNFRFCVISDPQFGMFANDENFHRETENFEETVSILNQIDPDFVVICGDLINHGNELNNIVDSIREAQIREFKRILSKINPDIRIYLTPGNHDIGNEPTQESLKYYRNNFGSDYYSFMHKNIYGIVLNSQIFFNPKYIEEEFTKQYRWLEGELKNANDKGYKNIIVFQHIPIFTYHKREKESYNNFPFDIREKILNLFHQHGVKYLFSGHLHRNAIGEDKELKVITTSAIGKQLGYDEPGIRIVEVDGPKLSYPYFEFEDLLNYDK